MFNLPDYRELEDSELRRTIADLEFQRDIAIDFLARAMAEASHRRRDEKEGVFRSRPPASVDEPKPH